MHQQKIYKIAQYALCAVALLPLIFFHGFFYPFIINKTLFFRLMVEVALTCYVLLLIVDYQKYKPKINTALKLVFALLGITVIAAILGLDPYRSFLSDFERLEGVTGFIYLTIYLFLLLQFFKEKKEWLDYIKIIVSVSFLVSVYGIIQRFNLLPVFEAGEGRVSSTVGNPAFLAGYLLLASGLGLYWALVENKKYYKMFAGLTAALNIFVLLLTATRGAVLGLVSGVFIFLLIYSVFGRRKLRKYAVIILLFIVFSISGFIAGRDYFSDSRIEFINRLANISLEDGSIKNRLLVWQYGWRSFKEHPVLGVGLENFNYQYNKYYAPEATEDWFDRTHNIYLDQLVQNGVFGLIIYLAILFYLFYKLWLRRKKDNTAFIILSSLLTAYAVHNAFVFDTISTAFLYFFIIGLISSKGSYNDQDEFYLNNKAITFSSNKQKSLLTIIIIANVIVLYFLIYLPFMINRSIYIGYSYIIADTEHSLNAFSKVLGHKLGSVEAGCQLYQLYAVLESQLDARAVDKQRHLMLTRNKLMEAIEDFPLEIRNRRYLGEFLIIQSRSLEELDLAEEVLLQSKELSPGRPEIYYLLYNLYSKKDNKAQGYKEIEELVEHLPWYGEAKIVLANLYRKKDVEQAEQLFNEGIKQYYPRSRENYKRIFEYLLYTKRYVDAIFFFQELIIDEPNAYSHHIDLSRLYFLTDDINKAMEEIKIVQENQPEALQGHEEYIAKLLEKYEEENKEE